MKYYTIINKNDKWLVTKTNNPYGKDIFKDIASAIYERNRRNCMNDCVDGFDLNNINSCFKTIVKSN